MKIKNRVIAAFCIFSMIISVPVFARKESENNDVAAFADEIIKYLSIYSRYEDVDQKSLYKAGLIALLEEHPELYTDAMKGVLESIDEHSEYYNPEETKALTEDITGEITGIGITFQMCDEGVDVVTVIEDTPASKGGVKVGDVIVSADGNELAGVNSDTAASYIKGEVGTTVTVGIKRETESEIIYIELVREKIVGTSVTNKIMEDGESRLMYIKVYGYVVNTAECFKKALDEAVEAGIKNLVVDVRDNGGGLFDQAISMSDMLVPKGSVITTEDHKISLLNVVYTANYDDDDIYDFDTVILINENSASASEVFAAAVSENDRAVLIGTNSYGKGTIQTINNLKYGDSMKYTVGYYLTPLGNNIHGVGLTPDAYVEKTVTPFEIERFEKFGFTQVYNIGDENAEIETAKRFLKIWGAYDGEINEVYDEDTAQAVKDFQAATNLYPYGVLDLTTQHELYTRLEKSKVVNDDQLDAAFTHFGMTREKEDIYE